MENPLKREQVLSFTMLEANVGRETLTFPQMLSMLFVEV
jgi:hypothetical protein